MSKESIIWFCIPQQYFNVKYVEPSTKGPTQNLKVPAILKLAHEEKLLASCDGLTVIKHSIQMLKILVLFLERQSEFFLT